jgi:NADPH:quinone reductase-like Zn-dependent oxidoreductase
MGIIVKEYPAIIGEDISGIIVSLGSEVNTIRSRAGYNGAPLEVGNRVIAGVDGTDLAGLDGKESYRRGAFQHFVVAQALEIAVLPEDVGFVDGAVLPLAMATAASCLFDTKEMGLSFPQGEHSERKGKGVVLVWGAASSVGACAVQMLKAAGYAVAATASEGNFGLCEQLGAQWIFDYKKEGVEEEIVKALDGKTLEGVYDAVMYPETIFACARIAEKLGGRKIVGTVYPPAMPLPEGKLESVKYAFSKFELPIYWR